MKLLLKSKYLKNTAAAALSVALASTFVLSGPMVSEVRADPVSVSGVKQTGFADLVEQVKPAVVSVRVKKTMTEEDMNRNMRTFGPQDFEALPDNHPFKRFFKEFQKDPNAPEASKKKPQKNRGKGKPRAFGQGSGFFISKDGYVVTNNHVIADGTSYSVVLEDGTELDAELVGADERTDLAVLKVDEPKTDFTYVEFGDDTNVRVGDWVVAVGNPFGLGGTVTSGIVSGRGRDIGAGPYDDFIQIDAAVNKGNSGGPAFNLEGQVVGINTAIFSPSGGNVGIAFAIPASTAKQVIEQLIDKGSVERGWIGVHIQPVNKDIAASLGLEDSKGALVSNPAKDGPAEKAKIKAGDVITAVNGEAVRDPRDLAKKIATIVPEEIASLSVWRDGESQTIDVTVGAMPEEMKTVKTSDKEDTKKTNTKEVEVENFGLTLVDTKKGVTISDIDSDGISSDRGINKDDIIVAVDGTEVKNAKDAAKRLEDAFGSKKKAVLLQLQEKDQNKFIAIPTDVK